MGIAIRIEHPETPDLRALVEDATTPPAAGALSDILDDLGARNAMLLVARVDGAPMGSVLLVDEIRYGEIKGLYVQPQARGLGIGQTLIAALEEAARDIGLARLRVAACGAATRALLTALGYRPSGDMLEKHLMAPVR